MGWLLWAVAIQEPVIQIQDGKILLLRQNHKLRVQSVTDHQSSDISLFQNIRIKKCVLKYGLWLNELQQKSQLLHSLDLHLYKTRFQSAIYVFATLSCSSTSANCAKPFGLD